jgi:hypothetical protein
MSHRRKELPSRNTRNNVKPRRNSGALAAVAAAECSRRPRRREPVVSDHIKITFEPRSGDRATSTREGLCHDEPHRISVAAIAALCPLLGTLTLGSARRLAHPRLHSAIATRLGCGRHGYRQNTTTPFRLRCTHDQDLIRAIDSPVPYSVDEPGIPLGSDPAGRNSSC